MTLATALDQLLPQTQCTQCGYTGCLPYAEAIIQGEAANRCVPGGQPLADQLAQTLGRPPLPVLIGRFPLASSGKPPVMLARIRETDCIGCTKCLAACPVDALVGARKRMHSVITDWCTGCELCLPPCPVDCIDLVPAHQPLPAPAPLRARYQAHQARYGQLARKQLPDHPSRLAAPNFVSPVPSKNVVITHAQDIEAILQPLAHLPLLIQQATLRSQIGKLVKRQATLSEAEQQQLQHLQQALTQISD